MKHTQKGFTLLELLVVILIIGILAAVALPQYQKAVEKSKTVQALALLKSVAQAQEAYKLATGDYATTFDELSVDIPWSGNEPWYDGTDLDTRSNGDWSIQLHHYGTYIGRLSGKYKGAGFMYFTTHSSARVLQKITCGERVTEGIAFEQTPGNFCEKIMKGTYALGSNVRIYLLP